MSKFVFILSLGILNNDLKPEFERFSNVFAQEFFSQKEMGALCYRADIGLTRAGTTSLAEQKLYDMKLFMVPIAWTHDQYDNAKYYVSQFHDLLIDQKLPDFETHLLQAFKNHA
jgi:UDP-N-acetylglucosamine:LPS N-acetylglucosamine transferase